MGAGFCAEKVGLWHEPALIPSQHGSLRVASATEEVGWALLGPAAAPELGLVVVKAAMVIGEIAVPGARGEESSKNPARGLERGAAFGACKPGGPYCFGREDQYSEKATSV